MWWGDSHFFPGVPIPGRLRRRGGHQVPSGETPSGRGHAVPNSLGEPSGIGGDPPVGGRAPVALRVVERPGERALGGRSSCRSCGRLPSESSWPAGRRRATPKPAGGEHFRAGGCGGWAPERFGAQRGGSQHASASPPPVARYPQAGTPAAEWPGAPSVSGAASARLDASPCRPAYRAALLQCFQHLPCCWTFGLFDTLINNLEMNM